MGIIKYFFALNNRGSPIVVRAFLAEPNQDIVESFYNAVIQDTPPPPVFRLDNFNFTYIQKSGLYFVIVTEECMAPSLLLELLYRVVSVISDYAGRCTELAMQQNLALIYEIVDEVLSFGCPQATDSSNLLHLVHNTVNYEASILRGIDVLNVFTGAEYDRPLAVTPEQRSKSQNEVFFILNERVEMVLTAQNQSIRTTITGVGTVKSYLDGQPSILIQLDPQMAVATRSMPQNLALRYDDIVFAPFVQTQSFDGDRSVTFSPPQGESQIFEYRCSRPVNPLFTLTPVFENVQNKVVVVRVSIQASFPVEEYATDVKIIFQCPVEISNASCELPNSVLDSQNSEFNNKTRQVTWTIKKFTGLQEFSGRFRFIFDHGIPCKPENILGPISLQFTHIGHLISGMTIKNYVVSTNGSQQQPKRWLKETTTASCYTFNFV
ncbi:Adaptor complexes medium subunit family protein [Tritrichomonas foetus]|uniref:Adaptor complexes medium subunit family protein n=1 Tax=Tritrichomonas foetus TaxID=1144522 RepID=A0A1J4KCC7_9EUKA|nr:Adaptor complexes medium subunit family protein [Tritrichomonas foetus]|eukprot:OHT08875.1 Adaptor complexes medium subunit family protein [Tritrichomonas foetus]